MRGRAGSAGCTAGQEPKAQNIRRCRVQIIVSDHLLLHLETQRACREHNGNGFGEWGSLALPCRPALSPGINVRVACLRQALRGRAVPAPLRLPPRRSEPGAAVARPPRCAPLFCPPVHNSTPLEGCTEDFFSPYFSGWPYSVSPSAGAAGAGAGVGAGGGSGAPTLAGPDVGAGASADAGTTGTAPPYTRHARCRGQRRGRRHYVCAAQPGPQPGLHRHSPPHPPSLSHAPPPCCCLLAPPPGPSLSISLSAKTSTSCVQTFLGCTRWAGEVLAAVDTSAARLVPVMLLLRRTCCHTVLLSHL